MRPRPYTPPPPSVAQRLFDEAFSIARSPRSGAYKAGVLAALKSRESAVSIRCPWPNESAESDAFYAGVEEGHHLWHDHLKAQQKIGATHD